VDLAATIEKTRRDLLELTARNRLVHTPLEGKRKSWLQIDDERSDHVFDLLVRQGKTMSFLPIESDDEEDDRDQFLQVFEGEEDAEFVDGDDLTDGEPAERHIDLFLQTRFTNEKLHDRLLRCFYDARTAEEEQGVSILYLACGFLQWRESGSSAVNRFAPLLLIPVELSRNSARSKFRLKFRDDEIVTNLSIQARLQQDFGIRLPDLPEGLQDDDAWKPTDYFAEIRELIKDRDGWEVMDNEILLWFFSFTKFLMFRDLSPEAWPEGSGLTTNDLIASLLGEGFGGGNSRPALCGDDEPIDDALSPADVIHVTDADSSQAVVVAEIAQGRNLVVQGPPGTGKSQTITNAIAAAVHAGKRVLFVSEKMAALDVVKRRLDHIGLGPMTLELHSHKARKSEVLEDLKATMDLGVPTGTKDVPTDELRRAAVRLRQHDAVLHGPVGQSGCSPFQAIGRLMRLRAAGYSALKYSVPKMTEWTPNEFQARKQVAEDLDRLLEVSGNPAVNAWRGVRCNPMTPADLERLIGRLRDVRERIELLDQANADLAGVLGLPAAKDILESSQHAQLASYIKRCPAITDRTTLTNPRWESDIEAIEKSLDNIQQLRAARVSIQDQVSDAAWDADWSATRIALAGYGKSWFGFLNSAYRQAVAMLRGVCAGTPPKDADERVALVDTVIAVQKGTKQVASDDELGLALLGNNWSGIDTSREDAAAVIAWVKDGSKSPFLQQNGRHIAARLVDTHSVSEPLGRIAKQLKTVDTALTEIAAALNLDVSASFATAQLRTVTLSEWMARIDEWLESPEQLSHYLATNVRIEKLRQAGLEDLADELSRGEVSAGKVADQLELIRSEAVLAEAWRDRPELAEFHGETYEKLRSRFAELDQQRIALSRLEVAKIHHENLPVASADSGQVSVVRREINKKRRHMPIRRLLKEAGQAIQKIKPVFMMSPLSVAQYLEPGAVEFDVLVIDEASQVEPVDALGAIARCRQIVVVGDQRQLPPTNFFGRISGDTEDDDSEAMNAGDVESILGLCEAQGLPNRMLRWHYRSRHESLIAVSNRQFYEDRLFIVPSPVISGGPLGLKLRYIPDGWYDRGGSRVNRVEAIAVAEAVIEHARSRPQMSLGVATFSAAQRDAIIDELELRRRENPSVEEFFTIGGAEPFFVKSLENVQGDQRDAIFISIGYARDRDGGFFQNFGPLNREGGERRLNVLISRAAAVCEVFTSIKADDIDLRATRSEGVAALKMYLHYAESGHLDSTQSCGDADSVFEEQVATALRNQGLEIDHQIGVGGFFIDLAIRDPERGGRYLLGIECDGAQYHSARWVRDRDRIRQQVLEARGWIIHRIWSTDWFQRPEEQLAKVLDALSEAKKHWDEVDKDDAEAATVMSSRITVKSIDGDSFWERVEVTDESAESTGTSDQYREANFAVRGFSGGPGDLSTHQLAQLMDRVVSIESPIHVDEIGRRCIKILGQGRLTASLKRKVTAAAEVLQQGSVVDYRGDFVYSRNQTEFPIRNRRDLENANLRKIASIAPEELQAAIMVVVTDHIGTDESETISSVAKLFGMSNSKPVQAAVMDRIKQLTLENSIADRSGKLFVG
jgi:very-short-patch-repair endonuclease